MRIGEVGLLTNDVVKLANFYKLLLETENGSDDSVHQTILSEEAMLTIYDDGTKKNNKNQNICLAFTVNDIDAEYEKLVKLGVEIIEEPKLRPWGAKNMSFYDPDKNVIYFRSLNKLNNGENIMNIKFKKFSDFNRGIIFELLTDAYSFDGIFEQRCSSDWKACDNFLFDNLQIADKCGFVTALNDEAIGFIIWDPRNMPEYVEIGHNCIASKHKGHGYAKIQLQEAVNRIIQNGAGKIIVSTNDELIPAQRMYESVGFKLDKRSKNESITDFAGDFIDYVYYI